MSNVVTTISQLEDQLRADGYKGTQRAMRLLRSLRSSLEGSGYSFVDEPTKVVDKVAKKNGTKKNRRATTDGTKKNRRATTDGTLNIAS